MHITTPREIIRFWIPLCATWLMMSAEGPSLTALIARMPHATLNLAAYGVAVALAMFIESPVIMLLSATVALGRDKRSVHALWVFMLKVNTLVTLGMLVVSIPWVYDVVTHGILALPYDVSTRMYWGFVSMIPWPAAIGFRRFYQGILIRNQQTKRVAYGTVVRFLGMGLTALFLWNIASLEGILIGTISLTCGVCLEAIATRVMVHGVMHKIHAQDTLTCAEPPSQREIFAFYAPLAMTSIMGFTVTPALAFFMNRAPESLASLAVLPVVDSFVFLFRSFGFSYQEVGIALIGENTANYKVVKKVGWYIMLATTSALACIALTPIMIHVFTGVYGLEEHLAHFAQLPTIVLIVLPTISVLYSVQRAVLITSRKNISVTISTVMEVSGILLVMLILVQFTSWNGALAAAVAMAVGRIGATIYLTMTARKVRKQSYGDTSSA